MLLAGKPKNIFLMPMKTAIMVGSKKNAIQAPNPNDGVTLDYKSSDQYKFYNGAAANRVIHDQKPYTEIILEASPSSRPLKTYGEGQNWGVQEANRFIAYNYLGNIHGTAPGQEKIIAWSLDNGSMPIRSIPPWELCRNRWLLQQQSAIYQTNCR